LVHTVRVGVVAILLHPGDGRTDVDAVFPSTVPIIDADRIGVRIFISINEGRCREFSRRSCLLPFNNLLPELIGDCCLLGRDASVLTGSGVRECRVQLDERLEEIYALSVLGTFKKDTTPYHPVSVTEIA
jgi:hypothetical protein